MIDTIGEAFQLLREMHPTAAELIVEPTTDRDPNIMWLHAVRAADGTLLWFDEDTYYRHPDAAAMGGTPELDYDQDILDDVEGLILNAYEDDPDGRFVEADEGDYEDLEWSEGRKLLIVTAES